MRKKDCISLSLLCSIMLLTGVVSAASNDPSSGQCDVLGHPSQLYPICIQGWSAQNQVEHLTSVGANPTAIEVAIARLNEAIATYAALSNGGTIPGFSTSCNGATFSGEWNNGQVTLTTLGFLVLGVWNGTPPPRPPFSGTLSADGCMVDMTFPDDATFQGTLTNAGCTIQWSNAGTWTRDTVSCQSPPPPP